jgi:PHD/YefM family antitoxin component YafN of YafNO toxin-antitoxin module
MRTVSQSEALKSFPTLLEETKVHPVVICEDERELGALISMEDYKVMRQAKAKNFLALCNELSQKVALQAEKDGVTLEDLEKELLAD